MDKDDQSTNLRPAPPELRSSIAGNGSGRPRGKVCRFLGKFKDDIKRMSVSQEDTSSVWNKAEIVQKRSKGSIRNPNPVLSNGDHELASLTSNIQIQVAPGPSMVKQSIDPQSALRSAKEDAQRMHPLLGHAETVADVAQNVPTGLDTADNLAATYLGPLRIFDSVIGKLADVHPYAKMALGVLSCASQSSFMQIILAQADRDKAVLQLLEKLSQRLRGEEELLDPTRKEHHFGNKQYD
ncbi:uncharacterized protein EDB93DRAFT_1340734 [Suillus bovinus]|uniref:uncharacterized protein n=1 Tax=Suillus bovinus TaxID=48563 RepID=UPI001B8759FF|nr:uncharacterized protein EDB93DRAFT_1340734 [Suillus bovinus]KAG2129048.1 hypothetical protein EDB93DRAFT_1340734 [Suillus bovinus]